MDAPRDSVTRADELVLLVMQTRYPMADFEQRAADISVDHSRVVENYRTAHRIVLRDQSGEATTGDLRNAMVFYRSLFDELLERSLPNPNREVA